MFDVRTQVEQIEQATFQERLFARLSSFFGLLALACVGLYGIISYGVSRRTNEIGVRMALGARRYDVLHLVLREGLQLTILGVILGVAAAWALTRFLTSFLRGVRSADPVTFGLGSLAVIVVSILRSYMEKHIKPAAVQAGITKRISRHTPTPFIRYLAQGERHLKLIQSLMRHSNVSVTADR